MSTRYLKKVYGNDIVLKENFEESEPEASDTEVVTRKKKQFNVFDLVRSYTLSICL